MIRAHWRIESCHALGSIVCDPTWNASPYGFRPSDLACRASPGTWPGGSPNMPWSPAVPPAPVSIRSSTADPGAFRAILRELGAAAGGESPHPGLPRAGDIAGGFDRVGEQHRRGVRAGPDHRADLRPGGSLEPAPGDAQAGQQPGMGVGLDRVVDRHRRERGGQLLEAFPGARQVQRQVPGLRLRGGGRLGHASPDRGFHAIPGRVSGGLARHEPEPYPAGQRPQQPRGAGQAPGADQEVVHRLGGHARGQLLFHRVPGPCGQPAPPAQVGRRPVRRNHRLHPDAAIEPEASPMVASPAATSSDPEGRYPAAKPATAARVPHTSASPNRTRHARHHAGAFACAVPALADRRPGAGTAGCIPGRQRRHGPQRPWSLMPPTCPRPSRSCGAAHLAPARR